MSSCPYTSYAPSSHTWSVVATVTATVTATGAALAVLYWKRMTILREFGGVYVQLKHALRQRAPPPFSPPDMCAHDPSDEDPTAPSQLVFPSVQSVEFDYTGSEASHRLTEAQEAALYRGLLQWRWRPGASPGPLASPPPPPTPADLYTALRTAFIDYGARHPFFVRFAQFPSVIRVQLNRPLMELTGQRCVWLEGVEGDWVCLEGGA